jgi:hypothetical protein
MTLHPDVLTDLVILYLAGEASQATRELLEAEAVSNPAPTGRSFAISAYYSAAG